MPTNFLTNLAGKEVFIQIKPGIEYMYTMLELLELFGDWSEPYITNKLLPELEQMGLACCQNGTIVSVTDLAYLFGQILY